MGKRGDGARRITREPLSGMFFGLHGDDTEICVPSSGGIGPISNCRLRSAHVVRQCN